MRPIRTGGSPTRAKMPEAVRPTQFEDIAGWAEDDHAAALAAFKRSAQEVITRGHGFQREAAFGGARRDWLPICEAALAAIDARAFFESYFTPFRVSGSDIPRGLFTGYYEPEAEGRLVRDKRFCVPIYRRPNDLVAFTPEETQTTGVAYGRSHSGKPFAYPTRREIEEGALLGRGLEICYLESWVDAFFMQVQGSGRVVLPGGKVLRLSYAAKNGQPYTGIGSVLLARGIGTKEAMSMQFLRNWMADNPHEARALLWQNSSFVFFREVPVNDPQLGAIGAAKVNLTPLRSLAVDRSHWMFGTPLFIETHEPPEAERGAVPFQHLMIAQDTGTAIKGVIRGDIYWGWGERAALNAGHMKSKGGMVALLPHAVVTRLMP
jgi:membrane-bound lytic murein transglycosylase A